MAEHDFTGWPDGTGTPLDLSLPGAQAYLDDLLRMRVAALTEQTVGEAEVTRQQIVDGVPALIATVRALHDRATRAEFLLARTQERENGMADDLAERNARIAELEARLRAPGGT